MLNFCDFIQVYVFTTNHHLKEYVSIQAHSPGVENYFKTMKCFVRNFKIPYIPKVGLKIVIILIFAPAL